MKLRMLVMGVCALSSAIGCAADAAEQETSEEELIRTWFQERGFDAATLEFEGTELIVEGDIAFRREYVLDSIRGGAEGQQDGATDPAGSTRLQGYWRVSGVSLLPKVNPFPICYLNELTGSMGGALMVAARVWSQAADSPADRWGVSTDSHIQIVVSPTCEGFDSTRIVHAHWDSLRGSGQGAFPELVRSEPHPVLPGEVRLIVRPGEYLKIDHDIANATVEHMVEVALHEIGHNLGFVHPGTDSHISDTASTPRVVIDPNSASLFQPTPAYTTVMRSDGTWNDSQFLFPDDERSAALIYRRLPSECPVFDRYAPDRHACSEACPCSVGVGDCDLEGTGAHCKSGLHCGDDNGYQYGLPDDYEVCAKKSTCPSFNASTPQTTFCSDPVCPCGLGEGDCDEEECGGYLVCGEDNGAAVGLPSHYEVCKLPRGRLGICDHWSKETAHTGSCTECPCGLGEGDCDSNSECQQGLVCAKDVGPSFGFSDTWDMCVKPGIFSNTY